MQRVYTLEINQTHHVIQLSYVGNIVGNGLIMNVCIGVHYICQISNLIPDNNPLNVCLCWSVFSQWYLSVCFNTLYIIRLCPHCLLWPICSFGALLFTFKLMLTS
eukprot:94143_1